MGDRNRPGDPRGAGHKTKIFLRLHHRVRRRPQHPLLPGVHRDAGDPPVLNGRWWSSAARAGLALGCEITRYCRFDRKNYFYPTSPRPTRCPIYLPIARNGAVPIPGGWTIRIHELQYGGGRGQAGARSRRDADRADYNRCGVPLIEIVTEPDFRTGNEVIVSEKLRSTLQYLGVSDCKMQEGSLRCDVNLSVRPPGAWGLGTRTEMKNLSSFKAISRAIVYEARRQIELIEEGGRVVQETRRWDENKDATYAMRPRRTPRITAIFPDPDILRWSSRSRTWSDSGRSSLRWPGRRRSAIRGLRPERLRHRDDHLPEGPGGLLRGGGGAGYRPQAVRQLIMGEVLRALSERGMEPGTWSHFPGTLSRLIALVQGRQANRNTAVKVFDAVFDQNGDVDAYVKEHGLEQISDLGRGGGGGKGLLAPIPNPSWTTKPARRRLLGFLVGQVMWELHGRADPKAVNEAVRPTGPLLS